MLFEKRIPEEEILLTEESIEAYERYHDQRRHYIDEFYEEAARSFPQGTLLEVNSGWGYTGVEVLKRHQELQVVALVESPLLLKRVREKGVREGVGGRFDVRQGKNEVMPFKEGLFEGVVAANVLHHWREPTMVLQQMYRVVKPGGLILMTDLRRNPVEGIADYLVREMKGDQTPEGIYAFDTFVKAWRSSYTREEVEEMFHRNGLSEFEITEEGPMTQTIRIRKPK